MTKTASFFYASLACRAYLHIVENNTPKPPILIDTGGKQLRVHAYDSFRKWVKENLNSQAKLNLVLFPKTDRQGRLSSKTHLRIVIAEDRDEPFEEGLQALGQLAFVNKDEALVGLRILPSPAGRLKEAFMLTLVANLEILESLPAIGSGLEVKAELRPRSLSLVVTEVKEVVLPPTLGKAQAK